MWSFSVHFQKHVSCKIYVKDTLHGKHVIANRLYRYIFKNLLPRRYEGRTESHEELFFACELGTADEGECGGRWNQLLCYH